MKKIFSLLIFFVLAKSDNSSSRKFYYDILEVAISASEDEISNSYKTLTKKYHPDKYGNSKKYTEIQRAYEILSNRTKKVIYDTDGIDEVLRFEHAEANGYVDRRYNRLQPQRVNIVLSLKEAYLGGEKNLNVRRQSICRHCQGTGAQNAELQICPVCRGKGITVETIRTGMGIMQMQRNCPKCNGQGKMHKHNCPHCHGSKIVKENKSLKIKIARGVKNGETRIFEGEGDADPRAIPGHIIVDFTVKDDPNFKRNNDDLYTEIKIEFFEALFGFKTFLRHLDGRKIEIEKSGTSQFGEFIKIDSEGMYKEDGEKGNLFVKILFELPQKINLGQKKIIREIFE
jgi:DnaJ-class molecular chaperone